MALHIDHWPVLAAKTAQSTVLLPLSKRSTTGNRSCSVFTPFLCRCVRHERLLPLLKMLVKRDEQSVRLIVVQA